MMFKLAQSASKRWRTLNGSKLLPEVIKGTPFDDGINPKINTKQEAA